MHFNTVCTYLSLFQTEVSTAFDCQQIWSYMNMAIVLFSNSTQVSHFIEKTYLVT